jgi:hypothetical protein
MFRSEIAMLKVQAEKNILRKSAYQGKDFYFSRKTIQPDAAFPGQLTFFNDVANMNGVLPSQTNLQAAGQTSNLDSFLLMGVRFGWTYGAADLDVQYLVNNLNLIWRFFNVEFFQGPPEGYPGGSAAYATAASSLATITTDFPSPVTSIINGAPMSHNYFPIGDDGVLINPQEQFQMVLVNTGSYTTATAAAGGTGLTLTAWLDGYRIRTVS